MISAGGQSGPIGSAHSGDLTLLWPVDETVPMHLEEPLPGATVVPSHCA